MFTSLSVHGVVLFTHVLVAMLLTGNTLAGPRLWAGVRAASTTGALRSALETARQARKLNPVLAVIMLASGVYLGKSGWWSDGWFWLSIALWVVNLGLAVGVLERGAQKLSQAVGPLPEGPVPPPVETVRASRAVDVAERMLLANDIGVLYAMLLKPDLAPAVVAVVLANLLVLAPLLRERVGQAAGPQAGAGAA